MKYEEYRKERATLISIIKKFYRANKYPCGFVDKTEKDGRLRVAMPARAFNKKEWNGIAVRSGMVITSFRGIDKNGLITDAYGHGMVTTYWSAIPIEDLYKIGKLLERVEWYRPC